MHPKRIKQIPANKLRPLVKQLYDIIEVRYADGKCVGALSEITEKLSKLIGEK